MTPPTMTGLRSRATGPTEQRQTRRAGALRDRPAVAWLVLALAAVLLRPWLPAMGWVAIHLVLLGALTHSIMVWSAHFTRALLKTAPGAHDRRRQDQRILLHIAGTVMVITGVSVVVWPLTVLGAASVSVAVVWHGLSLWRQLRAALPGRFRISIRYYLVAAACLPVGATFGVLLARGVDDEMEGRLLLAHSLTMVLGWLGLTVCGTLITLWPTMLRTRLDARAERLARQSLPVLAGALIAVDTAAVVGSRWGAAAAIAAYLAGLAWWSRALLRPARTAPPRHASTWSVSAALVWFVVTSVLVLAHVMLAPSWTRLADGYTTIALAATVGFAVQILIGALSHLVPVVIGGGARVWRTAQAVFDRYAVTRITVSNLGLVLWLLPTTPAVHTAAAAVCLLALTTFLPIMILAIRAALREKAARRQTSQARASAPPLSSERGIWSPGQFIAAVSVVAVALSIGIAWDPAAAGLAANTGARQVSEGVRPTGHTTTVSVDAVGMSFRPNRITVPAGDRLVIHLTNADPSTPHDLVLAGGADSGRLMPGRHTTIDVGVVAANLDGWCSVVGHRQMGMTFEVVVSGAAQPDAAASPGDATEQTPSPVATADPDVSADFRATDPVLPPVGRSRVHHVTLAVEDKILEVAPGVRQKRWTYNGTVPGPTLHGRLGDTFVVTLVNHGSMGHSIDFHAGTLAPDKPMRTVPPGASLTYTFTADRAGIWMYHCATMPMSAHIAAGLHGAVVIDPPGLAPVSASYVIQQGAAYVAGDGRATTQEVDAQAASTGLPTFFAFNGVAFQYDHRPIVVPAGQRIRLWLLDAGPTGPLSFHVVGGRFDTTYAEGAYLLRGGRGALGGRSGGSQVLALQPGQGGFVELTLPEPGTYPFTTHVMPDAERGAHGLFKVVPRS